MFFPYAEKTHPAEITIQRGNDFVIKANTERKSKSFEVIETLNQQERKEKMKELIETITNSLVDYPEKVSISTINGQQTTVLELRVAKQDLGKIIGKHGRTAGAMRTILTAVSAKNQKRAVLQIVE